MIYVTGDTHGLEDFNKLHIFAGELMRGQVFEVEGKTIFTFGGATSIDRDYPKLRYMQE